MEQRKIVEVERHVEAELRVGLAERGFVQPLEHDRPVGRRRHASEDTEQHRDADHRQATKRLDHLLVAVELRVELRVHGPGAERHQDAHVDGDRHAEESDEEHRYPSEPLRGQDVEEAELVVPEHFGVQVGDHEERDHHHGNDHRRDGEGDPRSVCCGRCGLCRHCVGAPAVGGSGSIVKGKLGKLPGARARLRHRACRQRTRRSAGLDRRERVQRLLQCGDRKHRQPGRDMARDLIAI